MVPLVSRLRAAMRTWKGGPPGDRCEHAVSARRVGSSDAGRDVAISAATCSSQPAMDCMSSENVAGVRGRLRVRRHLDLGPRPCRSRESREKQFSAGDVGNWITGRGGDSPLRLGAEKRDQDLRWRRSFDSRVTVPGGPRQHCLRVLSPQDIIAGECPPKPRGSPSSGRRLAPRLAGGAEPESISRGDGAVQLESKAMDVLVYLAGRPGEWRATRSSRTRSGRPSSSRTTRSRIASRRFATHSKMTRETPLHRDHPQARLPLIAAVRFRKVPNAAGAGWPPSSSGPTSGRRTRG